MQKSELEQLANISIKAMLSKVSGEMCGKLTHFLVGKGVSSIIDIILIKREEIIGGLEGRYEISEEYLDF
ncbi:hypothetical protein LQZ18_12425 [Lachnospiraceae bacterium ZAX-1]